jgi:glutamine synthetase
VRFVEAHGIRMINFRYIAEDGKLKTLNFIINNRDHLNQILSYGERVDGSSLFSFISAGSSDLYVIPRYRTAFVNPFTEIPSLDILCSFYSNDGKCLNNSPGYILQKAHELFRSKTGMNFKALGELEYYINSSTEPRFQTPDQKGYHASAPFSKFEQLRTEAMWLISKAGGKIKYGHNEVGNFYSETESFEQHEIEFLPADVEEAADHMVIAKWILRMLANRVGVELSFAPKISVGKAGSGLHIHMMVEKEGRNRLVEEGTLSLTAKKIIAGILDITPALTAFGNTIPTSYLRLVPNQEAPTSICWGDRNRNVLIRVPLGWLGTSNMAMDANPAEHSLIPELQSKQTIEFRVPDGSADIHNLLAGLVLGALHGHEMENAAGLADELYVSAGTLRNSDTHTRLKKLPASCYESACALDALRSHFERDGVFPPGMIDNVVRKLKSYDDQGLSEKLTGNSERVRELVLKYIHTM